MISKMHLNAVVGQQDIVTAFIVYRLKSYDGNYWTCNELFGHDDGGYGTFVSFCADSGDLVVSGSVGDFIVIGGAIVNSKSPIANYPSGANAGELNKWIVLSIQWIVDALPTNHSSVW